MRVDDIDYHSSNLPAPPVPHLKTADARLKELEAMAAEMVYAIPGGSLCDPQQISDMLRDIAAKHGVQIR